MKFKLFLPLIVFNFIISSAGAQDYDKIRSMNYNAGFIQIKDQMNYGLVFSGIQQSFSYRKAWKVNDKSIYYQGDIGFGIMSGTRNLTGRNFTFKPIDLYSNLYEQVRGFTLSAGPWVKAEYNYQVYPELQGEYSSYFTNYSLGFYIGAWIETNAGYFRLRWKNSLVGAIARQTTERDPYFYESSASQNIKDVHSNFNSGSFNLFNNSFIEFLFVGVHHPRLGYGYSFEYFSYSNDPQLKSVNHSFSLYFYPKM